MQESQISPELQLKRALSRWWIVVLCLFLGGGLGLVISTLEPNVYQADAEITINIDYTQTGALTDLQVDQVMDTVGDVLQSDYFHTIILNTLADQQILLVEDDFSNLLWIERAGFRFLVRARSSDPQDAQSIAGIYASTSVGLLNDALEHALIAQGLQRHLFLLEGCVQSVVTASSEGSCGLLTLPELQMEIDDTTALIIDERQAALGLLPELQVIGTELDNLTVQLVSSSRSILAVAGMLAGLLVGVWVSTLSPSNPKFSVRIRK